MVNQSAETEKSSTKKKVMQVIGIVGCFVIPLCLLILIGASMYVWERQIAPLSPPNYEGTPNGPSDQ